MNNETITIDLDKVDENPFQAKYYGAQVSAAEDAVLSKSLTDEGQRDPIVVRRVRGKDGEYRFEIFDGHRRVKHRRSLGHKTVIAVVRHDLEDASDADREAAFISYNSIRRQLNVLAQVRTVVRLHEIAAKRSVGRMSRRDYDRLIAEVGDRLSMSRRNVLRYLAVLRAPLEIQHAVETECLRLIYGARIGGLAPARQQEFVTAIKSTPPKKLNKVVAEMLNPRGDRHVKTADAVATLARNLDQSVADLADRVDNVSPFSAKKAAPSLRAGRKLINDILRRIPANLQEDTTVA
jgi:ParB/RepB/Spo0J family partition protein